MKLKIIQHCKQTSQSTPDSPTDEMFRTPNTTLDADDSGMDTFSTPIGDFSAVKMKSMNNLLDDTLSINTDGLSRMKSLNRLDEDGGDTPVDLVKLKRDFEKKRFNDAKIQSLTNLLNGDDSLDGMISKRHHSEKGSVSNLDRNFLQPSKTNKRIGNTKYVGGDHSQDRNYQIMKIKSMGTIDDLMKNNMKTSRSFDPFYNVNKSEKKYDKTLVVPIRLDGRFEESYKKCDNDDVFKAPDNPMLALRKENSSSCIESMKNRGSSLYDRFR